jgi:hypothetical protein
MRPSGDKAFRADREPPPRRSEECSNGALEYGLVECQINRLKTLKRAMYGRAGVELLRARLSAIFIVKQHGK